MSGQSASPAVSLSARAHLSDHYRMAEGRSGREVPLSPLCPAREASWVTTLYSCPHLWSGA